MDQPELGGHSRKTVPRLEYPHTYETFLQDHLIPNVPCIFPSSLTSTWPCFHTFLTSDSSSAASTTKTIDRAYLLSLQGSEPISVHRPLTAVELAEEEGEEEDGDETSDPTERTICEQTGLANVLDAWARGEGQGLYIKDWHLALEAESRYGGRPLEDIASSSSSRPGDRFYTTPGVFEDDWLNGYYRSRLGNDFRFVYLGASKTTTLLHRDVYSSYSFSTNVLGRKRWDLYPPSHSPFLRRDPSGSRSELLRDVRKVDRSKFTMWDQAEQAGLTVIQEEGETIFVPSGWYHQVENLSTGEGTGSQILSINHNWGNATNVRQMYDCLCSDLDACAESIADVKDILQLKATRDGQDEASWMADWVNEIQELCERDAGWAWRDFWNMVHWGVQDACSVPDRANRPPLEYVRTQVSGCVQAYNRRWEASYLSEVCAVVGLIEVALSAV
ncbi:Uncharacterized conserved protein, contains JmjC domain [Phaffia rhodozyma]|uniref:Uncharacterized conserved protein, contains JmjC domain n=1 Tax=Phaffia rhodozyma TaxID=264483 RepID=A0A0F7SRY5_PHARH|nr:Uncharacterized conserved protein, contains JmjC domain [Phaffia rhodozyma]